MNFFGFAIILVVSGAALWFYEQQPLKTTIAKARAASIPLVSLLVLPFSFASLMILAEFGIVHELALGPGTETLLTLLIIAPIFEELVVRGWLLTRLNRYFSATNAVFVQAVLFWVLHAGLGLASFGLFSILALGVLAGFLRQLTGSIVFGVALHSLHNFCALAMPRLTTAEVRFSDSNTNDSSFVFGQVLGLLTLVHVGLMIWAIWRVSHAMKESESQVLPRQQPAAQTNVPNEL